MKLTNFRPKPQLVTKMTYVARPRFPVIDAHNHLGEAFGGGWEHKPLGELLDALDEAGVQVYVDLDGGWGDEILNTHLEHFKEPAPERFRIFGGVDWGRWGEMGDGFPEWAARRLEAQKARGAEGVKIWKPFGLEVRDQEGELVRVDDPRLGPVWETASALGLPVMVHVADPAAFFDPIDETNERWEELECHPEWAFTSPPFPPFLSILDRFYNLVRAFPGTIFIGAHVGCYAENLEWVGRMLDDCPNYYVDISARLGELGRQPYSARRFFERYQDRILFGSDCGPQAEYYRLYYRFLETEDEYFNYSVGETPAQGRWYAYGLGLSEGILRKVYSENAERVLNSE
jgi:predicted TIM-barrel fold metal-dependent hydrolase